MNQFLAAEANQPLLHPLLSIAMTIGSMIRMPAVYEKGKPEGCTG
jgi:hypothetical protein